MCGYCVEQVLINDILEQEWSNGKPMPGDQVHGILLSGHAQESNFTLHGVQFARTYDMVDQVLPILHCRALEEIILRPESALETNLPQMALAKHFHAYQRTLPTTWPYKSIINLLPTPAWATLYQPEFVFSRRAWDDFMHTQDLPDQATSLVQAYSAWWLQGQDQAKNDLLQRMDETGVLDPLEDINEHEWERFHNLLPALYFALCYLGGNGLNLDVVEQVALTSPNGVPLFSGHDLWLQRKAMTYLVSNKGASYLIPKIHPYLRLEPVYYAFLRLRTMQEHRDELVQCLEGIKHDVPQLSEMYEDAEKYGQKMQDWMRGYYVQ